MTENELARVVGDCGECPAKNVAIAAIGDEALCFACFSRHVEAARAKRDAGKPLSAHQKIVRAAHRGIGVRLTVDEAWDLAHDTAVLECARNDNENPEYGHDVACVRPT